MEPLCTSYFLPSEAWDAPRPGGHPPDLSLPLQDDFFFTLELLGSIVCYMAPWVLRDMFGAQTGLWFLRAVANHAEPN